MSEELLDAPRIAPSAGGSCVTDMMHSVPLDLQAASRLFFLLASASAHSNDDASSPLRRGQCQWQASTPEGPCVTLAFDWLEIRSGVLCLADPMRVRSNLQLQREGMPIGAAEQRLMLANCVYRLNWQALVLEHLRPPLVDPPPVDLSAMR